MSDDNTSLNTSVENLNTPLIDTETVTINNIADIINSNIDNPLEQSVKIVSRTPSVRLQQNTTPKFTPKTTSNLPEILNSINNSINNISSLNDNNNEAKEDVKITIADSEQPTNVNLDELVRSLRNGTSSQLTPIRESPSKSPTLSQIGKSEYQNVKHQIIKDVVVPNFMNEIKCTVTSRGKWRNAGNKAELFSKVLTGAATIVAFAAGAYTEYTYLSFIAGCIGTGAMVCQQFSTYAKGESKERTEQANKILKVLNIDSIPDLDEQY
jgi:hypothetical protein